MANAARKPVVKADIQVIDELSASERKNGVLVRAKAARGHEDDARPIGGFFIRRRFEGDEFYITKPEQFSSVWMEFVDEPPKEWLDAMKVNKDRKAELMAKQRQDAQANAEQTLVFALSQIMQRVPVAPGQFNYATGQMRPTQTPPPPPPQSPGA